jgi:hypothetical protein
MHFFIDRKLWLVQACHVEAAQVVLAAVWFVSLVLRLTMVQGVASFLELETYENACAPILEPLPQVGMQNSHGFPRYYLVGAASNLWLACKQCTSSQAKQGVSNSGGVGQVTWRGDRTASMAGDCSLAHSSIGIGGSQGCTMRLQSKKRKVLHLSLRRGNLGFWLLRVLCDMLGKRGFAACGSGGTRALTRAPITPAWPR